MARRTRSNKLETRTNRLRLDIKTKPHTVQIAPRIHLGYRRNAAGPGSWSVLVKKPEWLRKFATADDFEDANGETVLDYWQALDRAKKLARAGEGNSGAPITVLEAVENYEADLSTGGGSTYNASTLKGRHLPGTLASKTVSLLKKRDFTDWRAAMLKKGLKPTSVDRYAKSLLSALNQAADDDERVANRKAWKEGLRQLPSNDDEDAEIVRDNFILTDRVVAAIVHACQEDGRTQGDDFGLLIDVLAECGCRESQAFRLKPQHLQDDDPAAPSLLMPTSRKGSNRKKARKIDYRPLPISPRLAKILRQKANSRTPNQPLLSKIWNVATRFRPVAERLGLGLELSPYCLRYSSITRQLLQGLPIAVVANNHDTSAAVIQAFYTRHLAKAKQTDALTRAALIDLSTPPPADNVTAIRAA